MAGQVYFRLSKPAAEQWVFSLVVETWFMPVLYGIAEAAAENHGAGVRRMVFYSEAGRGVVDCCPGGRGERRGESGQRNSGFST